MSISSSSIEKSVCEQFPSFLHPFLGNIFKEGTYLNKKTENFSLNSSEMKKMRSDLLSYPYYLVVDPTNICNLRCPLCPTWQDVKARPKGKMSMGTFQGLMDEVGPYLFALNLCNWGEPLLNQDLSDMVRYAKKYNTVTGFSTNLNYLTDETARALVAAGTDIMVISIDGASQESYSRYRVGGEFATVMKNIERLLACREDSEKFPLLVWQFLVNRHNEAELEHARSIAQSMGLRFFASPMRTSMGKELLLPLYERVKEIEDWLPKDSAYNKYAYAITPETRTCQETCKWLWNSTVVNWDGSVSPCCGVFEKMWDFEACHTDSGGKSLTLHQAWNSPRYQMARTLVAAYVKKSPDLASLQVRAEKEGLICSKCITYGFLED